MLVADVSAKGVLAAMALGVLRPTFRTLARESQAPAQLVARMASAVRDEWLGAPYVTCIVAKFETDRRKLTYTNAGHPVGVIIGRCANRYLNRGGPPAGLLPSAHFEQEIVDLYAFAVSICNAVMARALQRHGPPGVQHWEDDRTVVVVTVRDTTAAPLSPRSVG